jgi:hypothetical protein
MVREKGILHRQAIDRAEALRPVFDELASVPPGKAAAVNARGIVTPEGNGTLRELSGCEKGLANGSPSLRASLRGQGLKLSARTISHRYNSNDPRAAGGRRYITASDRRCPK